MDKQATVRVLTMVARGLDNGMSKRAGWWDGSWYNSILNYLWGRPKMHNPNLDINTIPASKMNSAAGRKILSNPPPAR